MIVDKVNIDFPDLAVSVTVEGETSLVGQIKSEGEQNIQGGVIFLYSWGMQITPHFRHKLKLVFIDGYVKVQEFYCL